MNELRYALRQLVKRPGFTATSVVGRPVLVGGAVGLLGGLMAGRALEGLLFEVVAVDPVTLGAATAGLAGAGLLACWLPARRATRIHPMEALRYE